MKILRRSDKVAGVPARWKEQYFDRNRAWSQTHSGNSEDIYNALIACNHLTADDVNRIIGNNSWTGESCDDCGKDGEEIMIQVGQEPDYESSTASLCRECVAKAALLINSA